jgi:ubiquitin-protein ligase
MSKILAVIYGLLLSPDIQDPVDTVLALDHYAANGIYEMNVIDHVKKYATKSRSDWLKELNL